MSANPTPATLPPGYYLDHFDQVVAGLRARYAMLLSPAETAHLATLDALSLPARRLYARLANRRGPQFRRARLVYPEIGCLDAAVAELLAARLLHRCDGEAEDGADPLACFTVPELRASLGAVLGAIAAPRGPRAAVLAWIAGWEGRAAWHAALLDAEPVLRFAPDDPWPFLRFLFFGEWRDNLSDFVTQALGHVVPETVAAEALRPLWQSRAEAEDAYRMTRLYADFRLLRGAQPAAETLGWWRAQAIRREALAGGQPFFDRLVDRLGRLLEREGEVEAAEALYAESPMAPARERRARLLLKRGANEAGRALLAEMLAAPCHAEEAYAARQLLARVDRTARRSEARHYQNEAATLRLDYPPGGVEAAVLAHYAAQGWRGLHSENWLWNAAFGLLLWDVIYDPALGGFHSPLQWAPADLHDPGFYERRRAAIETRLDLLADPRAALAHMAAHAAAKAGTANPFVGWHPDLMPMLEAMVTRLPPSGLAAALRHLARDIRHHGRGLPDLFLWRADAPEYRFIEVKAEGDSLAGHQYEWLRLLAEAGIAVSLQAVRPRA